MSTANFWYYHRCIVITDDDLEFQDHPKLLSSLNLSRSYPGGVFHPDEMNYLEEKFHRELKFHDLVMIYGYYTGACITAMPNDTFFDKPECAEDLKKYVLSTYENNETTYDGATYVFLQDFFEELKDMCPYGCDAYDELLEELHIPKNLYKLEEKTFKRVYEKYKPALDRFCEKVWEYEINTCDLFLNSIIEDYGYDELECIGVFSNGEALYSTVV